MKKILNILLIAVMIVTLAACGGKKEEEKKVIYVGTNAEFPPFEYLEDGKITGFDMELIEEIAKESEMEIKIEDMSFDGLLPALQSKKVDVVIAGMTANEERKKAVNFTSPYYTASQVIVVKKGDNSINSFDDLKGKKVGVMLGFTGDLVVSEIEGVTVERYNAAYSGIMALQSDKVDAVVLDSEPAKNYVDKNEGLEIAKADAAEEEYAIAVRKEDKELLEKLEVGLKAVKDKGVYEELLKKYF
ncbi:basic amino acid ABC transporter substrate-binding protein [uncultured Ilyobacter sp.]|uniref:basic amino acid ABC transporter substrate-binding protein n=1 Tax=uncultured Ilyobacter sp. TaxID=544433 RepID=UPI0029C928DC|nr:basic amino acid ABC transporter substrate-binding protein [uncultured Ilyobacter sp.]